MKRLTAACLVVVAGLLGFASPASAGGWAVTTLDPLPDLPSDEAVAIGFTIRQHGVTPVDLDGVSIVVQPAGGIQLTFPARLDGPTGHYVADMTVPAGSHRWHVVQGSFGPQDLGTLVVGGGSTSARPASEPGMSDVARWGLLAAAIAAAAAVVAVLAWPTARRSQPAR